MLGVHCVSIKMVLLIFVKPIYSIYVVHFKTQFITCIVQYNIVPTPEVDKVVVGCEVDQECPDYNACQNRKCVNPCAEDDPCAASANCKVIGHQPVCTCPDGYIGDSRTECKLRKHDF